MLLIILSLAAVISIAAAEDYTEELEFYNHGDEQTWGALDWCNANGLVNWAVQTDVNSQAAIANQVKRFASTILRYRSFLYTHMSVIKQIATIDIRNHILIFKLIPIFCFL